MAIPHLDPFVLAYIEAALWAEIVEIENRNSPLYDKSFSDAGYGIENFGDGQLDAIITDCDAFRQAAGSLLDGWTDEQAGHDFWLTRCGHGAGFWDRNLPNGDELSALVGFQTAFPNLDLYLGDDGNIYGFN